MNFLIGFVACIGFIVGVFWFGHLFVELAKKIRSPDFLSLGGIRRVQRRNEKHRHEREMKSVEERIQYAIRNNHDVANVYSAGPLLQKTIDKIVKGGFNFSIERNASGMYYTISGWSTTKLLEADNTEGS